MSPVTGHGLAVRALGLNWLEAAMQVGAPADSGGNGSLYTYESDFLNVRVGASATGRCRGNSSHPLARTMTLRL
jgi:hypothetical protein